MNQKYSNASGRRELGRSGALAEPNSVSAMNVSRQLDIQRSEGESWMMVYLDVITLLLVAFLFVIAHMEKVQELELEQKPQSGQITIAKPEEPEKPLSNRMGIFDTSGQDGILPGSDGILPSSDGLQMQQELLQTLRDTEGLEELVISVEPGKVNLNLPEKILFQTGRAELIGKAGGLLRKIIPILRTHSAPVSVEGHTDNVPIRTARFPSNWELSAARATVVLRYLIANGVPAGQVRAVGYADTRPVVANDTAEGRSTNRRVNLVVHIDGV